MGGKIDCIMDSVMNDLMDSIMDGKIMFEDVWRYLKVLHSPSYHPLCRLFYPQLYGLLLDGINEGITNGMIYFVISCIIDGIIEIIYV